MNQELTLDVRVEGLDKAALDLQKFMQLSNIGDIGIAPNFSINQMRNPMQDQFPLVNWLMSTSASAQLRNAATQGLAQVHKDAKTGEWMLMLPYSYGTLPPQDTTGACCWLPLDLAKCADEVPLRLLCLKDCENIMDNFINANRYPGANDMVTYFQNQGESVKAARVRMAKLSMAFFTARNIVLGVTSAGTDVLKPFHGLMEIMEQPSVLKILGANVLGAFDSLWCRLQVLGAGNNFVIAVHPLVKQGIDSLVVPGRFNQLPAGWARNGEALSFHGIQIIEDKLVPVDVAKGTGEAWILSSDSTGVYMGSSLAPTDNFVKHGFTSTDDPAQGCATECDFYYNYGAAFNTNTNHLAVITDIPFSANCTGSALQGLDDLIQPNTLIPMG